MEPINLITERMEINMNRQIPFSSGLGLTLVVFLSAGLSLAQNAPPHPGVRRSRILKVVQSRIWGIAPKGN